MNMKTKKIYMNFSKTAQDHVPGRSGGGRSAWMPSAGGSSRGRPSPAPQVRELVSQVIARPSARCSRPRRRCRTPGSTPEKTGKEHKPRDSRKDFQSIHGLYRIKRAQNRRKRSQNRKACGVVLKKLVSSIASAHLHACGLQPSRVVHNLCNFTGLCSLPVPTALAGAASAFGD